MNLFYRVNQGPVDPRLTDTEVAVQEGEFGIGSVGLSDLSGILFVSFLVVPMEVILCESQVSGGKALCRTL